MYTKFINDRQVFSTCKTIQTNDGIWISNPSEEQILAAGWEEYIPPVIEPLPLTEPDYTDVIDAVRRMFSTELDTLSDEDALSVAALYPTWSSKLGENANVGERLWYNEKLYKVVQAHTIQSDWTPDVSASLFTQVSIEEWPEFIQPTGSQDAYNTGDKITFEGEHYICLIDNCVWSPNSYPTAWEKQ